MVKVTSLAISLLYSCLQCFCLKADHILYWLQFSMTKGRCVHHYIFRFCTSIKCERLFMISDSTSQFFPPIHLDADVTLHSFPTVAQLNFTATEVPAICPTAMKLVSKLLFSWGHLDPTWYLFSSYPVGVALQNNWLKCQTHFIN